MKRIAIIAGIVLVLVIGGIFFFSAQKKEVAANEPTRAGIIMIGSRSDSSWNEAHWHGLQEAAKELNLSLDCEEQVSAGTCREVLEKMTRNGCRVIISTSIDFQDAVLEVAKEKPEVCFFQATGTKYGNNVASYMGRMYQMRYLAGIVAGRQTRSNAIGYITTQPIPEVIRGIDAFTLGVRKANPSAKVYVKYTNNWSDEQSSRQGTVELLDAYKDIDVLGTHIDTYAPLAVAEERGIRVIGCNVDSAGRYPKTVLTSSVWNWEIFYTKYIREALNGKFEGRNYLVGVDTGIVGLAPLADSCGPETRELVETERARLTNGEYDVFYGPIMDASGSRRVAEGESLSDKTLFEDLNWYVEGVVLP